MESVPYARFLADTGKGKTRMLKILHQICYNSFMAAGCSTISGALRMQSKWQGTACFNETDFKNTEDTALFTKWVNNGFERGLPIIMSNKENPSQRDVFDPFGPKLFAMKRPFEDPATEARLISVEMYETKRKDIPIHLPPEFYEEGLKIRNMLLDFRLKNWKIITNVPQEAVEKVRSLDVEPRLKQLMLPLLPIVLAYDGGLDEFISFIKKRQAEVRKQRAMSWEGTVFNTLLGIANNEIAEDEFNGYRDDDGNLIVVTTKMIANELNTSPKNVATTLREIGFDIEIKRVSIKDKSKVVRRIVIPSWDKWLEAVSRYYPDLENGIPSVPKCLKSDRYIDPNTLSSLCSVTGVTSVTNVTKVEVRSEEADKRESYVTDVTLVTPVTEHTSDEKDDTRETRDKSQSKQKTSKLTEKGEDSSYWQKLEKDIVDTIRNPPLARRIYRFELVSFLEQREYKVQEIEKVLTKLLEQGIVIEYPDESLDLNFSKIQGDG
jgi:hypothetical protein